MTIDASKIAWSAYGNFSGPYFRGTIDYPLLDNPDFLDYCLEVLSVTEGKMNAVNGYDSCIISLGTIQWCDKIFSATNMLGYIQEYHSNPNFVNEILNIPLNLSGASFKKTLSGKWRFVFNDNRGEISSNTKQRDLYFKGASGKKGEWSEEQKSHAKEWAAGFANLLADPEAMKYQIAYTKPRLMSFVSNEAKEILFQNNEATNDNEKKLTLLIRTAYISFAANNPKWALEALKNAVAASKYEKWSYEWVVDVLRELTFFKGIRIYPIRYEAIRPVLERIYKISLPKMASVLKQTAEGQMTIMSNNKIYSSPITTTPVSQEPNNNNLISALGKLVSGIFGRRK